MSNKFNNIFSNYLKENLSEDEATEVLDKVKPELTGEEPLQLNDGEKVLKALIDHPEITHIEKAYEKAGIAPEKAQPLLIKMGLNPLGSNDEQSKQADLQKKASPTNASASTSYGVNTSTQGGQTPESSIQGV
jgi:hypothetical protein